MAKKPIEDFCLINNRWRARSCKSCDRFRRRSRLRTVHGLVYGIYHAQLSSSAKRKHDPPKYTMDELRDYITNHTHFARLYDAWVESGYDRRKTPSIDRLDDSMGYSFDNIRLVSWEENMRHAALSRRNGEYGVTKPIKQYDTIGRFIKMHASISSAARDVGVAIGSIIKIINGDMHATRGFVFRREGDSFAHHSMKYKTKKKIDMFDYDWKLIKTFDSIADAAEYINGDRGCISYAIKKKKSKIFRGYKWMYHCES